MAFDDALQIQRASQNLSREAMLESVLSLVSQHPFALMDAARAREVGEFRLRLHGV